MEIVTSDPAALAGGVSSLLKFQIVEHKTGDPTTVRTR